MPFHMKYDKAQWIRAENDKLKSVSYVSQYSDISDKYRTVHKYLYVTKFEHHINFLKDD